MVPSRQMVHSTQIFIAIIAVASQVVHGNWWNEAEIFFVCKGRETGAKKFFALQTPKIAACLTENGKYCKYLCAFRIIGLVSDSTGQIDINGFRVMYDSTNIENTLKEEILSAFTTCGKGKNVVTEKNSCAAIRAVLICLYNEYIRLCQMSEKPKNLEVRSEEVGAVRSLLW